MQRNLQSVTAAAAIVVSITLACQSAFGGVNIFGFDHTPIGGAILTPNGTTSLEVANLGSSGNDGVAIDVSTIPNDQYFWGATLKDLGPASTHSPGSFVQMSNLGSVNGVPNQLVSVGRAQTVGANVDLSVDFSHVTAGPLRIEYRLGGMLVTDEIVPASSFSGMMAAGFPTGFYFDWVGFPPLPTLKMVYPDTQALLTPGGAVVLADNFDVFADALTVTVGRHSSVSMAAGGDISSFTITNETVTNIPEPTTIVMLGIGAAAVAVCHRRRGRK